MIGLLRHKDNYIMKFKNPETITLNHDRDFNHWVKLHNGDTISFEYNDSWWSTPEYASDYKVTISRNHREMFKEDKPSFGQHTCIINLFEMTPINTSELNTFKDYYCKLKELCSNPSIPYKNIYKGK